MVTKKKKPVRRTSIGTPRKPRTPLTPEAKGKVYQELLGIEVDIGQLGKALGRSDYKAAKKQLAQVIKRLQKIKL